MRILILLSAAAFVISCAKAETGKVDNPEKCVAQWQIRLESHRNMTGESDGWPEQLILDANQGGDFKMAQLYMAKFGWFAAASENDKDLSLFFMPDLNPVKSSDPRFKQPVAAILADGLKHACNASWISGVPFVRVTKRGEEGQGVLYSVTTENMPIREF